MVMEVVLIGGKKRNGKDEHAMRLAVYLQSQGKTVSIEHFATPLKSILKEAGIVTGLDINKAKERPMYQKFGNEVMKKWFGNNVWADAMVNLLKGKEDFDYILIPDFRYPCEYEGIRNNWTTYTFHVTRFGYDNDGDVHSSENALNNFTFEKNVEARDLDDIDLNSKVLGDWILA